jgi:hypothetical protein
MGCKLLEREEVPAPPRRVFEGVVDEGDSRWRYKQGLLVVYIRYLPDKPKRPAHELPWAEVWVPDDARR